MSFTPRNRMPIWLAVILLASGVVFAAIGLIPVVGFIVDFVSWIFFTFIFFLRGASFFRNKNTATTLVLSLIAGFIPEAGDFISDIGGLAVQIYLIRSEDKKYNREMMAKLKASVDSSSERPMMRIRPRAEEDEYKRAA